MIMRAGIESAISLTHVGQPPRHPRHSPRAATRTPCIYPKTALLAILVFFHIITLPVTSQEVAAWFAKQGSKTAYAVISKDVLALAAALKADGLPETLLIARIEEAARKKIAPAILRTTLAEDTRQYLDVADILRDRTLLPKDARKMASLIEQVSVLLRAGIDEANLEKILDAALAAADPKAKAETALDRTIAALSIVLSGRAANKLTEEESLLLGLALVESPLSDKQFSAALGALKSALAKGTSFSDALTTLDDKSTKSTIAEKSKGAEKEKETAKEKEKETIKEKETSKEEEPPAATPEPEKKEKEKEKEKEKKDKQKSI
jgi:hypothetical protein